MPAEDVALRRYSHPFHRHLSFFDRDDDGIIYFGDSLRGNLALGLDFPVAVCMAAGVHTIYGNKRPFFFGPINPIQINQVHSRRNMLEDVASRDIPPEGINRRTLVTAAGPRNLLDRAHVNGLWALAANPQGLISAPDIELYQKGIMLHALERRRRDNRDHVLPLYRGGPISVAGHSWFVDRLFSVKVYQQPSRKKGR